ncbi:bifunctional 4-hydroxy-2-oxoglutarate aldolase/2-dehydro-3-deoxy-phosphogluconate aldolase [Lentiprolixibacter aurantiacus]|uniref:Bifunctional 4-hydroxy-2-oxoglutarate aldolase/2-dehydro-3-deoxy-phosphogluconate aldolase n=1 Tax=Lentiprolixibacter aurantiacus TaxID=2993939 RepID=A0AAE3MLX4_9FLAO|nr:bifunctional 4-hydroxy-2-oxoglutarate aldolase/2-dehydro-3-deoxy-phosphogluconate aldolase [Lentiprolixibacter aurantiacus]MCX2719302.1 bifunctional 4-hydroxy-2-oxoglutarate aldolase/2-dehydro-3-deoxy-phosphogluconate aldolase [Lentiprolixibacter aurantiacus]
MAKYSRLEVIRMMQETGMVPLFHHPDLDLSRKVLKACYDGGARLLEFTSRGDFAHEVFSELNKYALKELPGMILGVGSITDGPAASLFMQMGANFIVTPSLREDIALICNRRKVLWSAGCGSLTEINRAEELGCEIVKLFPGSVYGPGFVKAIKAPQPWTSIMPTGGVTTEKENLRAWFDAGVTCVGMGSGLISKEILDNKDFERLEFQVRKALETIRKVRK